MKVAVYGQTYSDNALDYVLELLDELNKLSSEVVFEEEFYELLKSSGKLSNYAVFTTDKGLDSSFDMFISFYRHYS